MDKMTSSLDKTANGVTQLLAENCSSSNNNTPTELLSSPKQNTEFTILKPTTTSGTTTGGNSTTSPSIPLSPFEKKQSSFKTKIKEISDEQSKAWASLIERQQNEEKQLNNERVEQQCACFLQLLSEAQKQRKKDMELRHKKETDLLKSNQAKQSVEDSNRLKADSKTFRTKQDRERRLRELQSTNMKKFIDERKRLSNKHQQENSTLVNLAKEEEDTLTEENNKVISRAQLNL